MDNLTPYMCKMSEIKTAKTAKEEEYEIIIKRMSEHILKVTCELTMYKQFHDEILENGAIQSQFDGYNNTIHLLKMENNKLLEQLEKN